MLRKPIVTTALVLLSMMALLLIAVPIARAAAPANDSFAGAAPVTLPVFTDTVDTTEATVDAGDPGYCALPLAATVWYKLTLGNESLQIDVRTVGSTYSTDISVLTGAPGSFASVACGSESVQFFATAGQTYYFMIGAWSSAYPAPPAGGTLHVAVNGTPLPPPVASMYFYPAYPSIFSAISFQGYWSYDPVWLGIQTWAWDFGDGAIAQGVSASHQYAQDGDYTVQLTVTTVDGRRGSTAQVVPVRTHDVAIVRMAAPHSGRVNQTSKITVSVSGKRASEMVMIALFKSTADPSMYTFQWLGSQQVLVPARSSNRAVTVNFSYTFTQADAMMGKVTFKAVATIIGADDALPADNEARATAQVPR